MQQLSLELNDEVKDIPIQIRRPYTGPFRRRYVDRDQLALLNRDNVGKPIKVKTDSLLYDDLFRNTAEWYQNKRTGKYLKSIVITGYITFSSFGTYETRKPGDYMIEDLLCRYGISKEEFDRDNEVAKYPPTSSAISI